MPYAASIVQPPRRARTLALRPLLPARGMTVLFYTLLPGCRDTPPRLMAVTAARPRTWLGFLPDGKAESARPATCHGRWRNPVTANRALQQAKALFAGYRQNRSQLEAELKRLDANHDRRLAEILGNTPEEAPHAP